MAQPVEYTCPLIDSTIKLISQLSGDENTIQQIIDNLESLRSDNIKLREWGVEMELEARISSEELEKLQDKINYEEH